MRQAKRALDRATRAQNTPSLTLVSSRVASAAFHLSKSPQISSSVGYSALEAAGGAGAAAGAATTSATAGVALGAFIALVRDSRTADVTAEVPTAAATSICMHVQAGRGMNRGQVYRMIDVLVSKYCRCYVHQSVYICVHAGAAPLLQIDQCVKATQIIISFWHAKRLYEEEAACCPAQPRTAP